MIYFLNRGLILEQEIVKALKKYFSIIRVPDYYKNFTVNITNEHPFARMWLSEAPEKDAASLFPVVVIATEEDSKPPELLNLVHSEYLTIEPSDIAIKEDDSLSDIEARYEMITPPIMNELRAAMDAREDKRIFGATSFIRRSDHISIEIWAENPQLKNELYEIVRLFVCGFMKDYLESFYKECFKEVSDKKSPLAIFDSSIRGQRSNNFNVDFGIELYGANITFDADYVIEQSIIDTELNDNDNILLEVINHVKGYGETTREWIIGPDDYTGTGEESGTSSGGSNGNGEIGAEEEGPDIP